jgi:hypothetical protein
MFAEMHGELFDPKYWQGLQRAISHGEVMDVFPYRRKKRFIRHDERQPERASSSRGDTSRSEEVRIVRREQPR